MKHINRNSRQRGAALIVGLVLLAVITLLAVVGMNISNSELASANSEQIRLRAFQSSETGLEHGLVALKNFSFTKAGDTETADPEPVEGSPEDIDGNPIDSYTNTTTFHGEGSAPGFGQKFSAFNYSILSEGKSSRNAVSRNELGAYRVNNSDKSTFDALPE